MIRSWHLALQIVALLVPLGHTHETTALPTPSLRDEQGGHSGQHRRNAQLAPPHIDINESVPPGNGTEGPMRIGIDLKSGPHGESQGEGPDFQGTVQQHDGTPGSLAPIVPYFNNTSISSTASTSEYTTSMSLPNGDSVSIEHHVSIDIDIEVHGADGSLPGSEMPGYKIPIPNPLPTRPPPRPTGEKTCRRKSVTLTETKTVVKQVVTTITSAVTTTVTEPKAAPPSVPSSSQTRSIPMEPAKPPSVSSPPPAQALSPTHAPASSSSSTISSSSSASSSVSKQSDPSSKPPSAPAGFQSGVVGAHNEWREKYGAKALTYDADLAAKAQEWADKCIWEHPEGLASNLDSAASSDGNAKLSPEDILQHWINGPNEASSWNPSSPVGSHFTQAVWKGATKVGCAILSCDLSIYDASWWPAKFAVCIYDTGNVIGQFESNVGSMAS